MTPDERKHLANVLAWARADGWQVRWRGLEKGPTNANPPCPRIEWDQHEQVLKIRRPAGVDGILRLPAFSVTQAIDLLASYDLLPVEFHSAYDEGVADYRDDLLYELMNDKQVWAAVGREMDAHGVEVLPDDDSWETAADLSAVCQAVAEAIGARS